MRFNVTLSGDEVRKILIAHLAETNCEVSPDAKLARLADCGFVIEWETGPQQVNETSYSRGGLAGGSDGTVPAMGDDRPRPRWQGGPGDF